MKRAPLIEKKRVTGTGRGAHTKRDITYAGNIIIPSQLFTDFDLSPETRMVYLGFLFYTDVDGYADPGRYRVSAFVGVNDHRVDRCIKELESVGLIERADLDEETRKPVGGYPRATRYRVYDADSPGEGNYQTVE